jgi:hypothetical protein
MMIILTEGSFASILISIPGFSSKIFLQSLSFTAKKNNKSPSPLKTPFAMVKTTAIISLVIYFLVAAVSLVMAVKCLSARKFLPFHGEASGREWEDIDKPLQAVLITLLRISGLGFLVVFLLLAILPVLNLHRKDLSLTLVSAIIPFIFCSGLFLFNYLLFRQTKARTPWKGALISMIMLLAALVISIF